MTRLQPSPESYFVLSIVGRLVTAFELESGHAHEASRDIMICGGNPRRRTITGAAFVHTHANFTLNRTFAATILPRPTPVNIRLRQRTNVVHEPLLLWFPSPAGFAPRELFFQGARC